MTRLTHSFATSSSMTPARPTCAKRRSSQQILTRRLGFGGTGKSRGQSGMIRTGIKGSAEAHLYITRNGDSTAAQGRTFGTAWRATRREKAVGRRAKGLFLHIENVQPRRFEPTGREPASDGRDADRHYYLRDKGWKCRNDRIAPAEGFSDPQLERLALVYVAASARRGRWLIPAFHATVDFGLIGGHDDPQNFDLNRWAQRLGSLLEALRTQQ